MKILQIQTQITAMLIFCLLGLACGSESPWKYYSPAEKMEITLNDMAFKKLEFSMVVLQVTEKIYNVKTFPDWFVGKIDENKSLQLSDSVRNLDSKYFDFKEWPLVRLKADFELTRIFNVGDTIIKEIGSSDLFATQNRDQKISLFPPLRWQSRNPNSKK